MVLNGSILITTYVFLEKNDHLTVDFQLALYDEFQFLYLHFMVSCNHTPNPTFIYNELSLSLTGMLEQPASDTFIHNVMAMP